jgi:hypothetical protein
MMVMMHMMDHARHIDTAAATRCIKPRKPAHPPPPNLVPTAAITHLQQLTCPPCTATRSSQHSAPMLSDAHLPGAQPGCARCSCSAQTGVYLPHPTPPPTGSARASLKTSLRRVLEKMVPMAITASSGAGITATYNATYNATKLSTNTLKPPEGCTRLTRAS